MKVAWYITMAVATLVIVALVVLLKRRNSKSREMDTEFKAAGIVFADKNYILGAVQVRDGVAVVDGVGGGRDEEEDYVTTAFREAFEELLEPPPKQKELIPLCVEVAKQTIKPKTVIRRGSYMMLVCSLDDLVSIMKIAKEHNIHSTVYNTIPTQLDGIIDERRATEESEFKKLYLLPLKGLIATEEPIYDTFDQDIKIVSDLAAGSS